MLAESLWQGKMKSYTSELVANHQVIENSGSDKLIMLSECRVDNVLQTTKANRAKREL